MGESLGSLRRDPDGILVPAAVERHRGRHPGDGRGQHWFLGILGMVLGEGEEPP